MFEALPTTKHNSIKSTIMSTQIITPSTPANGFTAKFLDNLKPIGKRFELSDKGMSGLRLRVSENGIKTFMHFYKENGRTKKYIIGKYGAGVEYISLSNARKALLKLKQDRALGISPTQADNSISTVNDLAELYYTKMVAGGANPHKRPDKTRQILNSVVIPEIGKIKLNVFERSPLIVSGVIQKLVDRGVSTHAGGVLSIIKCMSRFGATRGYIQADPTMGLKKSTFGIFAKQRERALDYTLATDTINETYPEIRGVISAVIAMPKMTLQIKISILILLLSGIRKSELRQALWSDIDLEKGIWTIPKENSAHDKKGSTWQVPLSPLLCALFRHLKELRTCNYVTGINKKMHSDKAVNKALDRLLNYKDPATKKKVLDIEHISPHDLRRTFRTHIESLDVQVHVAEKCLNHSLGGMLSVYNKKPYFDERREAINNWSKFITDIAPVINEMGIWEDE